MKTCTKCRQEKPLVEFYNNGKESICRQCRIARQTKYNLAYYKTEARRQTVRRDRVRRLLVEPEKVAARSIARNAKRRGELQEPLFCYWCGEPRVDGEPLEMHHLSYAKGMEKIVEWVHRRCHAGHHAFLRKEQKMRELIGQQRATA